ncbi:hypothetical protein HPP92_022024 [Vanilla planifolia]|uniref:COBRA-like protein n=2 Tax=Vanilla planifolia TaxID=51239 RepID=A0A835PUY2_VANPL|nr:hypothetical protein HPP92_022024 [Vanilla planifolia]
MWWNHLKSEEAFTLLGASTSLIVHSMSRCEIGSLVWPVFLFLLIFILLRLAGSYDPMDPKGNITIKWDFQQFRVDGYTVMVGIYNYQLYRHIDSPGWKLSWTWGGEEVIWDARGAETTEQGNCSMFKGNIPHCCEKSPIVVDLLPGSIKLLFLLGTSSSDTSMNASDPAMPMPYNFSIGVPGYTCSNATVVAPTKHQSDGGRHNTQALLTWVVTCLYSQFRESIAPKCCVSLSTFYNDTIVPCPTCSCGCQGSPGAPKCAKNGELPQLPQAAGADAVLCTRHMCPIRVHWHLKLNYREYWRVKLTISNFHLLKNYSDWTLVLQHPNLRSLTQVFSFNYRPLIQYGNTNDTGVFWGVEHYNEMLLQEGEMGNVQTEMLLRKEPGAFTLQGGWPFPRKVSFNGQECVMPTPDEYPSLPRGSDASPLAVRRPCFESVLLMAFAVLLFV